MSTIPKHFGLKYREESYMHKELEKVRKETKKDFLRFKQTLASKPAIGEGPVHCHRPPRPQALGRTSPGERGHISHAGPRKPSGSPRPKVPGTPAAALLLEAHREVQPPGPGESAAPVKTRPFRPHDFYLRSSAYLRHPPQRKPPVIAPGAGTSRPAVLLPPRAPPLKLRARPGRGSPQPAASRHVPELARGRDAGLETGPPAEVLRAKQRQTSSTESSEDSDAEAASRRGRVRIRTHLLSDVCEQREAAGPDVSKTVLKSLLPSDALEADPALLPARVVPTSIEEIIASLHSEAQRASDQTIKELIQSVLGQNYDIKMEVGEP